MHCPDISPPQDAWYAKYRLGGLRSFAITITAFTILGHTWFGFEQSYAQPLVAILAAYAMQLTLELVDAFACRRRVCFLGGGHKLIDFLLSAHIPAMATAMLLYANDRLWPISFAAVVAIGSKSIFRIRSGTTTRHFLNPSNFGISVTLLLFPWVGISPPYHFTENLVGIGDWILPAVIVVAGTFLNAKFTKRIPLIATWLAAFLAQAVVRAILFDTPVVAGLLPMTGVAFLLFTFYMITDPPTSPGHWRGQVMFGLSVAVVYGILVTAHIVFGLFFALTIVCAIRGLYFYAVALAGSLSTEKTDARSEVAPVSIPVPVNTAMGEYIVSRSVER